VLCLCFTVSCDDLYEYDLPETNSMTDENPPAASFAYAADPSDFTVVNFNNLSTEATTFLWDFGGGDTSSDKDPVHTFSAGEGTYPVTLTASDALGASSVITIDVVVAPGPYQPFLVEPGFEDNTLPSGSGDGRDSWRNSTLGGVIQITGSPVTFGDQGAKMPASQDRIGYQEFIVEKNSTYDLGFYYTMLSNSADPSLTVAILGVSTSGPYASREEAIAGTIASVTVNDDTDPDVYLESGLTFDSGENDLVAVFFYNGPVEARLDNFTIDIGVPGPVPPSPGFDVVQSDDNFLEYSFNNTSVNAVEYLWDFGDGNTSTEESPTHTYATANMYEVTLTVTSEGGLSESLSRGVDIQAPVTVDCSWEVDADDYRTVHFTDASVGAESLLWEFGDGFQFTGMEASHTYREDGIYTVTLTSTSVTGLTDSKDFDVTISQGFIATISESGFEDNSAGADACGSNLNGTDCWRNSALGGPVQITSGPVVTGSQAAKLPTSNDRIGYQRVMVEPNTLYEVGFNYTMKTSPAGSLTVSILDGSTLTDISQVPGVTLVSTTVNDQTDANTYIKETLTFNSGARSEVAIFFSNVDVETRLDDFTIEAIDPPMLSEAGFEDNSPGAEACGTKLNGTDCWRNSALGGPVQITSGPVVSGSQAAKLPTSNDRIGYQLVSIEANTMYTLTYNYTMKTSPAGSLTVSILDNRTLNDISEVPAATIATTMVNDQTDADAYIQETLTFNSGSNTEVAVFFTNQDVECRIDDISLALAESNIPMVLEGGFEPNSLPDGTGDGKNEWRNDLGGVIQITSSPVNMGVKAAKLPSAGDRVGMQEIAVEPNTNYRVSFYYTMKTSPTGSLTFSILDNTASTLTDLSQVPGATISSLTLTDQTDANAYIMETIEFNSGSNSAISIFFHNDSVECRVDDVSITAL